MSHNCPAASFRYTLSPSLAVRSRLAVTPRVYIPVGERWCSLIRCTRHSRGGGSTPIDRSYRETISTSTDGWYDSARALDPDPWSAAGRTRSCVASCCCCCWSATTTLCYFRRRYIVKLHAGRQAHRCGTPHSCVWSCNIREIRVKPWLLLWRPVSRYIYARFSNITVDDFRDISIGPGISNLFELCICSRYSQFFVTSDNQLGSSKNVGCSHAIYTTRWQSIVKLNIKCGSIRLTCVLSICRRHSLIWITMVFIWNWCTDHCHVNYYRFLKLVRQVLSMC